MEVLLYQCYNSSLLNIRNLLQLICECFYSDVFLGKYSEGVRVRHNNTLKARYSQCVRHLSIGDVATLRGRLRQPLHSTAKKDYDAHLSRYSSIQSLPATATQYSALLPSFHTGCTLKPQSGTAAEAIYATPVQMEPLDDVQDGNVSPPLPPPPLEFLSTATSSEVVPVRTKVHHTYANVSEAVQSKSASAIESSFRPGDAACLSSAVNSECHVTCAATAPAIEPALVAVADSTDEDAISENDRWSTPSWQSVHSNPSSSSYSLDRFLTSASAPSCSSADHLPPPPPQLSSVDGVGLSKKLPPLPRRRVTQAGGRGAGTQEGLKNFGINGSGSGASAVQEAPSSSHNLVNRDIELTTDQMQHSQPPHHLLLRADHTRQGVRAMVAPLKVIREHPQVARITKRSFSVDSAARQHVITDDCRTTSDDVDSSASDDTDGSFLALAELARQEYIRRRASAVGCEDHVTRTTTTEPQKWTTQSVVTANQHDATLSGEGFRRVIEQKAVDLQRNKVAATSNERRSSFNEAVPFANGNHRTVTNSTSNEQCLLTQVIDSKMKQNKYSSETSQKSCDHEHSAVILSGRTSFGSSHEASVVEPRSSGLVVLPPPPDFIECNGEYLPNAELISSSTFSAPAAQPALDMIKPPPPPEFSDSPNRDGSNFGCRPVATWSVNDVAQWLDSLHMGRHCDMFVAHSVDGHRLMELGRSELLALGVSQVGQRMNLERAIKRAVISMPSSL